MGGAGHPMALVAVGNRVGFTVEIRYNPRVLTV